MREAVFLSKNAIRLRLACITRRAGACSRRNSADAAGVSPRPTRITQADRKKAKRFPSVFLSKVLFSLISSHIPCYNYLNKTILQEMHL